MIAETQRHNQPYGRPAKELVDTKIADSPSNAATGNKSSNKNETGIVLDADSVNEGILTQQPSIKREVMVNKAKKLMNSVESVHNRVDSLFESAERARQVMMQRERLQ